MRLRSVLKWLLIAVGGVLGIALLGATTVYVLIGIDLGRTFDGAGASVYIPDDKASVAEGERLARLRGCNGGCHGDTVNGALFFDAPDGTRVVAPDLGRAARNYSIEELERMIRHGIRPDGTSVIALMPSSMFYHLSDHDLGAIIAFLKTQAPGNEQLPVTKFGPLGRLLLFYFKQSEGTILAAEIIDHGAPRLNPATSDTSAHGRYLAMTVCTECHGEDLRGFPDESIPTLAVVAGYSIEEFRKLMRKGEPIGGRTFNLMAEVAKSRFSHFSDPEIISLHAYLQTLASTEPDT